MKQLATGDEVALTEGTDIQPRFSPDGSQLLFVRGMPDDLYSTNATISSLYRIPLVGGVPKKVASNAGPADWAPDGHSIVFIRVLEGTPPVSTLLVVPAEGGEPKELARWQNRLATSPRFSPDGRTIVVASFPSLRNSGARYEIVDVNGGSPRSLTIPPSLGEAFAAAWQGSDEILFGQATQVRFGASRLWRCPWRIPPRHRAG